MAKRDSGLLSLLIILPWWVSVIVAALAYIGLSYILPNISTDNPILQAILKNLPALAPLIAFVLLIPAPISAFKSYKSRMLFDQQKDIDSIGDLSWREFELLVGEAYRRQGFKVIENQTGGADGGIDLRLSKNGQHHLVQCKQWKKQKVGVNIVREMYGVLTAEKANTVIIISGHFTTEAERFAADKPIELINGPTLAELIKDIQLSQNKSTPQLAQKINTSPNPVTSAPLEVCPKCNSNLVFRTAKQGKNEGQQFYGCSNFPKCRFTKQKSEYFGRASS
jgi:restriction system protein